MRGFTGNPFVDAGIAGMCAAAGVDNPEQLDMAAIRRAVDVLYQILLSDSAFVDRKPYKVFATSTMAMLFPNSPLPQVGFPTPDIKRQKYRERVDELVGFLVQGAISDADVACFACGQPAHMYVGIDRFPLVGSSNQLLNFHPLLGKGHPVCAFCALAVQFLPLAVMQTKAEGGRLWFIHTADPSLAVTVAREYGVSHLQRLVAAGEPLRFAGTWACPGENGAVVSLLSELGTGQHARLLEQTRYPVSAIMFSNDNREQFIKRIPVPHQLIEFFNVLQQYADAAGRFENELLRSPAGSSIAGRMLAAEPIIALCMRHDEQQLLGGWELHRLYAQEVLGMNTKYIHTVQEVAGRLVTDERGKKTLNALKQVRDVEAFNVLLDMVRDGWITRQQLHLLSPPGEAYLAGQARDYLLGAAYALQHGEQLGDLREEEEQAEAEHPLVASIERVGNGLSAAIDEAKRLVGSLRQAQRPQEIRRAFLRLIATGHLRWQDFLFFCPPDDANRHYQSRDYWLAFLYDRFRREFAREEASIEQSISQEV
ncbi:MAG: hypothetical protein KatS3mg023_0614 [Armatimonadota bacterium]|nr:MAG: hypothetical protein KatS3mg023_0614 [Armatimonadota bacterium]